jgi:hypothetical protein
MWWLLSQDMTAGWWLLAALLIDHGLGRGDRSLGALSEPGAE